MVEDVQPPPAAPLLIGWKEWLAFPEWGIRKVKAKIDTGAKTSAINGIIEELRTAPDGTQTVVLQLALSRRHRDRLSRIEAAVVRSAHVRNTGGSLDTRLVVETLIRMGRIQKRVQLTVADRHWMLTPIILGRQALEAHFLVDVSRKFLLSG